MSLSIGCLGPPNMVSGDEKKGQRNRKKEGDGGRGQGEMAQRGVKTKATLLDYLCARMPLSEGA